MKEGKMYSMLEEINQEPQTIEKIIEKERENIKNICRKIKEREIKFVICVARGTSDNACTYGRYLFEYVNRVPVSLCAPSIYTLYKVSPCLNNCLVIGVSQSGEAPDVRIVLNKAKQQGALTLGIVNNRGSLIAKEAEEVIYLHAGKEKSVAATKTYVASLVAFSLISGYLVGNKNIEKELKNCAKIIEKILKRKEEIKGIIEGYRFMDKCVVLGRGLNYSTALETGLKFKETSYIVAEAYSAADFLHGPIAMLNQTIPVFVYAPEDATFESMKDICLKVKERNPEMIIVSSNKEICKFARSSFYIPEKVKDIYTPIVYITIGQLMAYYLSLSRGLDPDNPRGLNKITRTI